MPFAIDFDPEKAESNRRKHGVGFEEAATAFADPLSLSIPDPEHSDEENRWILLGLSRRGRLIVVVHTDHGDRIRVISARPATRAERRRYEQG